MDSVDTVGQKLDGQQTNNHKTDGPYPANASKRSRSKRKPGRHDRQRRHPAHTDGEQSVQPPVLQNPVGLSHADGKQKQQRVTILARPLRTDFETDEQHLHATYLHASKNSDRPMTTQTDAAGSPRIAFYAGLPSGIASGELTKPSATHVEQQDNLTAEKHAFPRQLDVERILTSLRLLGYEVNESASAECNDTSGAYETAPGVLQGAAATFFHGKADPIQHFWALIITFHQELDRLMPALGSAAFPFADDTRWKEEVTMGLLTQISPALGRLGERVNGQVAGVLKQHEASVKFFAGRGY